MNEKKPRQNHNGSKQVKCMIMSQKEDKIIRFKAEQNMRCIWHTDMRSREQNKHSKKSIFERIMVDQLESL